MKNTFVTLVFQKRCPTKWIVKCRHHLTPSFKEKPKLTYGLLLKIRLEIVSSMIQLCLKLRGVTIKGELIIIF